MLENFMVNNYRIDSYIDMNNRFCYIDYVDKNYKYKEIVIQPIEAYRYQGNLFGLFSLVGVSPELYVYTMYLNNYTNPSSYEGKKNTFKIPVMPPIPTD